MINLTARNSYLFSCLRGTCMTRLLCLALFSCALLSFAAEPAKPAKVAVGEKAPAFKIKDAQVRSVVFDNNVINPAYPNYVAMRQLVQQTIDPSPSPTPATSAPSPAANIKDVCAYDPAQAQAALAAGKPRTRRG